MDSAIVYRYMEFGEEIKVFELISRVFNEFVAPGYSNEGIEEFMKYAQPEELAGRLKEDQVILVAEFGSEIVGVIDILNYSHVASCSWTLDFSKGELEESYSEKPWRYAARGSQTSQR